MLMEQLAEEWNQTEQIIKLSEMVTGKAILPAIRELRYAGRRAVTTFSAMVSLNGKDEDFERHKRELEDALLHVYRARRDATDAAIVIIGLEVEGLREKYGAREIQQVYPAFRELTLLVRDAQIGISEARRNLETRADNYRGLERNLLPKLVEMLTELKLSEFELKRKTHNFNIQYVAAVIATLLGVAASIWAILL